MKGDCRSARAPVSFIIPTRNEQRNVRAVIESVIGWAGEVFVLDSYSDDCTVAIAREAGAEVAQRRFDNFSAQKNWALDNLPLHNEWVFFLDADERVPYDLCREIATIVSKPKAGVGGYYVGMVQRFMDASIRHGGWYPNMRLLLFRHRLGRYEPRIVHEHLVLRGKTGRLKNLLVHDDRKGMHQYFERHNVYSTMEAIEAHRYLEAGPDKGPGGAGEPGGSPGRRRMLKQWAYAYLPCRPLFKFMWSYFLRRGFLDGRVGFRYCVLQSIYEYQVSLKLLELRSDPTSPMLKYASSKVSCAVSEGMDSAANLGVTEPGSMVRQ